MGDSLPDAMSPEPTSIDVFATTKDAAAALPALLEKTRQEFVCVGVSFDRCVKDFAPEIERAVARGVRFRFLALSRQADLGQAARQFGQSIDELRTEVEATYAALSGLRNRYGSVVSARFTTRLPTFKLFVSDPGTQESEGILTFYGLATDSPVLPAFRFQNTSASPFHRYYLDIKTFLDGPPNRRVFVVHGHNEARWRELEKLLATWGVEPVVLIEKPDHGASTVIEKFERHAEECVFAIGIFTKDDVVKNSGREYFQARPNALFELGWFFSHLGRKNVLLLLEEGVDVLSDLSGVLQKRFVHRVAERGLEIRAELELAGILSN
jgi:hypothetical protein